MFDLRSFIKETLVKMVNKEEEYKVRQYAIGWYDKGVLIQEDLEEIETIYNNTIGVQE